MLSLPFQNPIKKKKHIFEVVCFSKHLCFLVSDNSCQHSKLVWPNRSYYSGHLNEAIVYVK